MYYSIYHQTSFRYSKPVTESIMEVRKQPYTHPWQRCLSYELVTQPRAQVMGYQDFLGNFVHHFDIPSPHENLVVQSTATVEVAERVPVSETLTAAAWSELDRLVLERDFNEMLMPSPFVAYTPALVDLANELDVGSRLGDPLTLLNTLNRRIHETFTYTPDSTKVDSPIDEAISTRKGVCQDYAHIMISLIRRLGIPCRYVSGYISPRSDIEDDPGNRSASHAWVEAFLPEVDWIGFDPTNDHFSSERHIMVAIGRDYSDVPPTKGIFKGDAESELQVQVSVKPIQAPMMQPFSGAATPWTPAGDSMRAYSDIKPDFFQHQQQQQQ